MGRVKTDISPKKIYKWLIHMKRCSVSAFMREMQNHNEIPPHFH